MARIYIEDEESSFLYLNVDLPLEELEPIVEALNRYSNGEARIERTRRRRNATGGSSGNWSLTREEIEAIVYDRKGRA
jgi:hypothetical protein